MSRSDPFAAALRGLVIHGLHLHAQLSSSRVSGAFARAVEHVVEMAFIPNHYDNTSTEMLKVAVLALLATPALALRQPWEYLEAVERFQQEFLDPQRVVKRGRSEVLADDIVGRVDVTTTFEGQELNTEYLFGLFANIRDEHNTSILGFPSHQTIQTLVVEPPVVYFSAILQIGYPTIQEREIPVQVDVITAWNDDLKMISYDATFRRFPLWIDEVARKIGPTLAEELEVEYDPEHPDRLFAHKAATDICPTAMTYCVGQNQQYSSYDECYNFLTVQRPWGGAMEGGLDTTLCRYIHRNMVPIRPDVHCAHIGPSGGDMCIDRDYVKVATAFPFKQTLVAVNTTWDDRDMAGLSQESVKALARAKLTVALPTTVAFFSVPTFGAFMGLYVLAKTTERTLAKRNAAFKLLSQTNRRNLVTYVLATIVTTIALGFQLMALPSLRHEYTPAGTRGSTIASTLVVILYLFELIYRESMRTSLLVHHLCTLLAISSLYVSLEHTFHPATTIWLFQATTEQSVFIGLIMYRLRYNARKTRMVLRFAAIQSFACKLFFAVYLLLEHTRSLSGFTDNFHDIYFSIVVYTIGSLLLTTQVWGSWAVWAIAQKLVVSPIALPHTQPSRIDEASPLISATVTLVGSLDGSDAEDGDSGCKKPAAVAR